MEDYANLNLILEANRVKANSAKPDARKLRPLLNIRTCYIKKLLETVLILSEQFRTPKTADSRHFRTIL